MVHSTITQCSAPSTIQDPSSTTHRPLNSLFSLLRVQDSSHAEVDGSEKTLPHALLGGIRRQLDGEETCVAHLNTGGSGQAKDEKTIHTADRGVKIPASTTDLLYNTKHCSRRLR